MILDDEMMMLDVLDISKVARTTSDMERLKGGSSAGMEGRGGMSSSGTKVQSAARQRPSRLSAQIRVARAAIEMLWMVLRMAVYSFLERKHKELAKEELKEQGIL